MTTKSDVFISSRHPKVEVTSVLVHEHFWNFDKQQILRGRMKHEIDQSKHDHLFQHVIHPSDCALCAEEKKPQQQQQQQLPWPWTTPYALFVQPEYDMSTKSAQHDGGFWVLQNTRVEKLGVLAVKNASTLCYREFVPDNVSEMRIFKHWMDHSRTIVSWDAELLYGLLRNTPNQALDQYLPECCTSLPEPKELFAVSNSLEFGRAVDPANVKAPSTTDGKNWDKQILLPASWVAWRGGPLPQHNPNELVFRDNTTVQAAPSARSLGGMLFSRMSEETKLRELQKKETAFPAEPAIDRKYTQTLNQCLKPRPNYFHESEMTLWRAKTLGVQQELKDLPKETSFDQIWACNSTHSVIHAKNSFTARKILDEKSSQVQNKTAAFADLCGLLFASNKKWTLFVENDTTKQNNNKTVQAPVQTSLNWFEAKQKPNPFALFASPENKK